MTRYLILFFLIILSLEYSFSQTLSKSDTLVFEYDDSYLTVYKHTPNCYFLADIPMENGFCFEIEKEIKSLDYGKVQDMRYYVYKFNKEQNDHGIATFVNVTAFTKHLRNKKVYLKKGDKYIKIRPLIYID